jgi:hypothetical protein
VRLGAAALYIVAVRPFRRALRMACGRAESAATVIAMNLAVAIIAALAAVAAAVAAIGSWKAAGRANETAGSMAGIERDRRHDEMTPEFEITGNARDASIGAADMRVTLTSGMDRLDSVTLTVLDDANQDHWAHGLPGGISQEEAEAFVWGPWEFNTGASAQVDSNRTTKPRPYDRVSGRNWDLLSLHATRPGTWMSMSQDDWQRQYVSQPMRLLITCYRDGYEPWSLLHEVMVKGPPMKVRFDPRHGKSAPGMPSRPPRLRQHAALSSLAWRLPLRGRRRGALLLGDLIS